jgi:pyridoxamine 5'-phosphate oxidase family protein
MLGRWGTVRVWGSQWCPGVGDERDGDGVLRLEDGRIAAHEPYAAATMSVFTETERRYLVGGRQLGRIATVGADGTPHVVPVAFIYNAVRDTIDIGGHELEQTKKFRDVVRTGRAAIVIDDLQSTDPWRPRGIEVRGRGEAIALPTPLIRIHPQRIVSWGIDRARSARTVASAPPEH